MCFVRARSRELRKGYKVVLWLVESSGGIERGALRHLNLIAKRITGNKGSDRTKYGTHPLAPKSFVPHHMQRLSVAAVKGTPTCSNVRSIQHDPNTTPARSTRYPQSAAQ